MAELDDHPDPKPSTCPSRNARKHGLTEIPPIEDTLKVYREILNSQQRVEASYATHEVDRCAYALAECEVQVDRAIAAEQGHLFGNAARVLGDFEDVDSHIQKSTLSVSDMMAIVSMSSGQLARQVKAAQEKAFWKKAKLLGRYRREAETRRRKALRTYQRALIADEATPVKKRRTPRGPQPSV